MNKLYFGIVEDNVDPLRLGRVRVRIVGIHTDNLSDLPSGDLPWSSVVVSGPAQSGLGSNPFLLQGSQVVCSPMDDQLQEFVVLGAVHVLESTKADTSKGFADPSGEHPAESYIDSPSVNHLARHESIEDTVVQTKNDQREIGNVDTEGRVWDEPISPYEAVYPYNRVFESESGIVVEIDGSPGSERVHVWHPSGSYLEIDPNGTQVQKSTGDFYKIVQGTEYTHVHASQRSNIDKSWNVKVGGSINITCAGNTNVTTVGATNVKSTGNINLESKSNINIKATGNVKITGARIDLN